VTVFPPTVTDTVAPPDFVGNPAPALVFRVTAPAGGSAKPLPKIVKIVLGEMPEFENPLGM
jgi:hypothetical protein